MITTPQSKDFPEISWEIDFDNVLDSDSDERMKAFYAAGCDKEGNSYAGSAYFFVDNFEQMEGIEKL